jgi:hypothetical protein
MKKIMATISTLLLCVVVLAGCGKADPVQDDLINYINKQLPALVELENKVTTQYEASTGKNFIDDAKLAAKLKDVVIPASNELVAKTKAIVPATEEVKKVHSKYLAVVTEQHEAFNMFLQAVQKSDEKLVDTANGKLTNAEKVSNEYLADLEALKKAHKVETAK